MAASQTWIARVRSGTQINEITVVGATEGDARKAASRSGAVISLRRNKKSRFKIGMNRNERFIFLMRLSTMVSSKFPATEALRLMSTTFSGRIAEAARTALPQLQRGVTLGDALSQDARNFPGSVGLLIRTGSASGDTGKALREAAEFERLIGEASKGATFAILQAFAYQFVALALLLVNQYKVVPDMFESEIMKMAKDTDFSLWKNIGLYFIGLQSVVIAILLFLVALGTIGRRIAPDRVDALILKIPIMRDIVISQDNFIGLYRLSLLIQAGIPINEALTSCAESTRPGALREDFKRAVKGMSRGEKWAKFMMTLHPTDRAALLLMPDADELAKNLSYMAEQAKALYLQRLNVVAPIMNIVSAIMMSVAGFIILIVTTIPQLILVQDIMG